MPTTRVHAQAAQPLIEPAELPYEWRHFPQPRQFRRGKCTRHPVIGMTLDDSRGQLNSA
jgi:hypothetical protein